MKAPTAARPIFIEFMAREGVDRKAAALEFDEFLCVNGMQRTKESYLTMSRVGSMIPTNRAGRLSIYMTFENALNTVMF